MQNERLVLFSHDAVRCVLDQLSPFSRVLQVKSEQPPCPPGQKQFDEVEPCVCANSSRKKKSFVPSRHALLEVHIDWEPAPGSLSAPPAQKSEQDRWK